MDIYKEIELTTECQQLVPANIAYHYGVVPKEIKKGTLHLYAKQSTYSSLSPEELELILGNQIEFEPVNDDIINKALSKHYRSGGSKAQGADFELGNDFLENLIWDAKSTGSSDIHFESFKDMARIRFRIDGKLIERYKVKKEDYPELVNKIKIKSKLNITEKRLPQDGRIHYDNFDIRVSILPTLYGEKIVMRILGRDTTNLSIDVLGMNEKEKDAYMEGVNASKGIVLISGPTGSGKTTTLYATLKLLNKINTNILTIEDPIEYTLEGINQVQLNEGVGLTFSSALKTFLRQDPDIIMVGEIRDEKTAQMAIRASLTGHLVLSTIHTNSALGTISRLVDMGVPSFLIAETLRVSVAQRLVRKLCDYCKVKETIDVEKFKKLTALKYHYLPVGCDRCFHTGYKGRIAIYELIPVTQKVVDIIKEGKQKLNYDTLKDKAFKLIEDGITTYEEVYSILIEDTQLND
ncbi:GspE/PulE family protein [Mesonia maritima]|uniref:Type II secretory ATPase GspE/PulE/Tfp pilus assembly ATPase PilB-like protein n=2 Tax=Mesonia maritima TaxID=1793873 RepID=A0ABU1K1D4_9FLAO|nr:GspE/PulE family protein [Mesonia maritima]MDR6299400.1 type II secretory ATPase GspE/PulE/Tfp pilus assembly ATPase PilB-like protein [Mesonia maritima]